MKSNRKSLLQAVKKHRILVLLLVMLIVFALIVAIEEYVETRADRVSCLRGFAAAEAKLRSNTEYGTLVKLDPIDRCHRPVWNIQGYDYITFRTTAHYTTGT